MSQESHANENSLSLDAEERIAEHLIRFSKALTKGEQPAVETFLQGFAGEERAVLLRELLLVEIEHRGQAGELVSFSEYHQRFPQDRDVLNEAEKQFRNEKTRLDPNQELPEPGEQLHYVGDYELLQEIGRGGMGIVYKARQVSLGRNVAVKMLLNNQLAGEEEITRFEREAKLASKPRHENIVTVYEVGRHEGRPYFSMDFVEGQSLAAMVREHPLPPQEAARYVQIAANAVHQAHEVGILHRDIKPSNILIDKDDQVRITDFGLAKQLDVQETLTETGSILGTASYMPPEQAEGNRAKIGVRSDVYSLGAVLYELLTGRPPFAAATVWETIHQVKTQEVVSPRTLNPKVPRDLETICLACLEKEPGRRYASAIDLSAELERFLGDVPIVRRPASRPERAYRWCRRNPWMALSLFLLVFTAVTSPIVAWYQFTLTREKDELVVELGQTVEEKEGLVVELGQTVIEKEGLIERLGQAVEEKNRLIGELETTVDEKNELIGRLDTSLKNEQIATGNARDALFQKRLTLYDAHMKLIERAMKEAEPDLKFVHSLLEQHRPLAGETDIRHFEWYYWWRQSHLGVSNDFLSDMNEKIRDYAFSRDGRFLVAAGMNKYPIRIQLFDHKTGEKQPLSEGEVSALGVFQNRVGESLKIVAVQRKPNERGQMVAIQTPNGKSRDFHIKKDIVVWDVKGREEESRETLQVQPGEHPAEWMIFSPDGRFVATSMTSRLAPIDQMFSIGVWEVKSGKLRHSLQPEGLTSPSLGSQAALAFSPRGDLFAAGDGYGSIQIWSVPDDPKDEWKEETLLRPFDKRHYNGHAVGSLVFNADGTRLISGEETGELTIWDLTVKSPTSTTIKAHSSPVTHLSLATPADGSASRLISIAKVNPQAQGIAKVWDLETRELITQLVGHKTAIDFAMLTADAKTAITVGSDYKCKSWTLDAKPDSTLVAASDITSDGRWVVRQAGEQRYIREGRVTIVNEVTLSVKDRQTGKEQTVTTFTSQRPQPSPSATSLRILAEGKLLAFITNQSESGDPELQVWDVEERRVTGRFQPPLKELSPTQKRPAYTLYQLTPSANGQLLAVKLYQIYGGKRQNYVAVFETRTLRELGRVPVTGPSDFQLSDEGMLYIAEKKLKTTHVPKPGDPARYGTRIARYRIDDVKGVVEPPDEKELLSVDVEDWWLFPEMDLAVCERAGNPALIVWKLSDLTQIQTFEGYSGTVDASDPILAGRGTKFKRPMVVSSDGRRLACDGKIFNVDTGQETFAFENGIPIAFTNDDRTLVTKRTLVSKNSATTQFSLLTGASDE